MDLTHLTQEFLGSYDVDRMCGGLKRFASLSQKTLTQCIQEVELRTKSSMLLLGII